MPKMYLEQFFDSLVGQTFSKWDLVIVNDGFDGLKSLLKNYSQLNIYIINGLNNIVKNREIAIRYARSNGYENIIFGDADDYFSSNRIAHSIELLRTYDIVVNDLSSVDSNGQPIVDKLFSARIKNNQIIEKKFTREKNIFGLSNTATKAHFFDNIVFDERVVALDWFIFSQILSNGDIEAIFTNEVLTYYRQHELNTAGIGKAITPELIITELRIKRLHYSALADIDSSYSDLLLKTEELSLVFENNPIRCKEYCDSIIHLGLEPVFWWESITL